MVKVFFSYKEVTKMLGFIIMFLILSSVIGDETGTRKMLRGMFTFLAVMYGIRIIMYTGFSLLPLIIIGWAVMNIAVPFVRGFVSSFQKNNQ